MPEREREGRRDAIRRVRIKGGSRSTHPCCILVDSRIRGDFEGMVENFFKIILQDLLIIFVIVNFIKLQ